MRGVTNDLRTTHVDPLYGPAKVEFDAWVTYNERRIVAGLAPYEFTSVNRPVAPLGHDTVKLDLPPWKPAVKADVPSHKPRKRRDSA